MTISYSSLRTTADKIGYGSTLAFAFCLHLPDKILVPVFFVWSCLWLVEAIISKRLLHPHFSWKQTGLYAMVLFYVLMLISLTYSENTAYAARVLERRLAFLVLPLTALFGYSSSHRLKTVLWYFVLGGMFSLLLAIFMPIRDYLFNLSFRNTIHTWPDFFVNSVIVYKHRSYFGMLQLCALLSLLFLKPDLMAWFGRRAYWWFTSWYALLIGVFMYAIGGRIVLIGIALLMLIGIFAFFWRRSMHWVSIVMTALVLLVSVFVYLHHPRFQSLRYEELTEETMMQNKEGRIGIWYSAISLLQESHCWLGGIGIGDSKDELMERYQQNLLNRDTLDGRSHAHNLWLQTLIEVGCLGVVLLLGMLLWPLLLQTRCADEQERRRRLLFSECIVMLFILLSLVEVPTLQIGGLLAFSAMVLFLTCLSQLELRNRLPKQTKWPVVCTLATSSLLMIVLLTYPLYGPRGFDPKDPRSYAKHRYELLETLPGDYPPELVGCKGYKISSISDAIYDKAGNHCDFISGFIMPREGLHKFSVWCYVSEDFDGKHVKIRTASPVISMSYEDDYNLSKKGSWQRLEIEFDEMNREIPFSLFFRKYGVRDLSDLQGYVVFALPQFE